MKNKGTNKSGSLITLHNTSTMCVTSVSMCVPSFNLLGLTVPEESVTKKFQSLKIGEKEKLRNKETNKQQQPDSGIHDTSAHCPLSVPSFNLLGLTVPEKSVTKIFLMLENCRERKMKNKGMNKSSSLIPIYTIHPPIVHMCNKFQPSRPHCS